jgi:hypothetical protein
MGFENLFSSKSKVLSRCHSNHNDHHRFKAAKQAGKNNWCRGEAKPAATGCLRKIRQLGELLGYVAGHAVDGSVKGPAPPTTSNRNSISRFASH